MVHLQYLAYNRINFSLNVNFNLLFGLNMYIVCINLITRPDNFCNAVAFLFSIYKYHCYQ